MNAYLDKNGIYGLAIGKDKLARNADRWRRVVGAAIIIYVDPSSRKAFWANLKDNETIGPSQIFVSNKNCFDADAKNTIASLCGNVHRDLLAMEIETLASDFPHLINKDHIQIASRQLYKDFNSKPVYLSDSQTKINFTRRGWRHITRKGRAQLTRYQSFVLLGTVRKILNTSRLSEFRKHQSVSNPTRDFISIKAAVTFPFRQTSIVKIILEISAISAGKIYNFHTIYEPRRRRDVMGARRPLSQ